MGHKGVCLGLVQKQAQLLLSSLVESEGPIWSYPSLSGALPSGQKAIPAPSCQTPAGRKGAMPTLGGGLLGTRSCWVSTEVRRCTQARSKQRRDSGM